MEANQLITKVQNSLIDDAQKKELIDLIPQMSDQEKTEVENLVERSDETLKNAEESYQKELTELNQKTELKLESVKHQETQNAINAFEKLDSEGNANVLTDVENEMGNLDPNPSSEKGTPACPPGREGSMKEQPKRSPKKSDTWLIVAVIGLIALISATVFMITKL